MTWGPVNKEALSNLMKNGWSYRSGGGSGGGSGSSVQPDWDQNDPNAADYVKNRTHYETVVRADCTKSTWQNASKTLYKVSDLTPSYELLTNTRVVAVSAANSAEIDNVTSSLIQIRTGSLAGVTTTVITIGTFSATINYAADKLDGPGIYVNSRGHYKELRWVVETSPLNEKYIPDTIARKSDLEGLGGGVVKSVNGVTPDENGDAKTTEPKTFVFTIIDGDVGCPYDVSELIKFASNASAYNATRFVHRVRDLFNSNVPIRDYVWTDVSIPSTGSGVYRINFGDEVAPILIDSTANTIILDPEWVAPAAPLTESDVNTLIDVKLGVIENGTY